MSNYIDTLHTLGTSTWLDDLSRDRLQSGNLQEVIDTKSIVGVTTNPAIFAAAMGQGTAYDEDIAKLKAEGASVDEAVYSLAIDDVRAACDVFAPIYEASGHKDGRVSIEVDPRISDDAAATIAQARELWAKVDRPNLMIKIPAGHLGRAGRGHFGQRHADLLRGALPPGHRRVQGGHPPRRRGWR